MQTPKQKDPSRTDLEKNATQNLRKPDAAQS